jgi:hypothetical protein
VPSPRVLDASDNALTRLPPQLPNTLNRLVLSNNRLTSLAFLQQLANLKVWAGRKSGRRTGSPAGCAAGEPAPGCLMAGQLPGSLMPGALRPLQPIAAGAGAGQQPHRAAA